MPSVLRTRVLRRLFGSGIDGIIALAVVDAMLERVRRARTEGEVVLRARLDVGETYTLSTRPAPDRKERKLLAAGAATRSRLERAERPTRRRRASAKRSREAAELRARLAELDSALEAHRADRITKARRRSRRPLR